MSAIGPGDWVECVRNRMPTTLPPLGLVVGCVYCVAAVGVTPDDDENPGVPWLRLFGVMPRPGKLGHRMAWFRPIYRPKSGLIEGLLKPADAPADLQGVDA